MNYEISREIFKQRLEKPLNFALIELGSTQKSDYKDITFLKSVDEVSGKFSDKNQNILLFNLEKDLSTVSSAASALKEQGYQFVYYFAGDEDDLILDKGLN